MIATSGSSAWSWAGVPLRKTLLITIMHWSRGVRPQGIEVNFVGPSFCIVFATGWLTSKSGTGHFSGGEKSYDLGTFGAFHLEKPYMELSISPT